MRSQAARRPLARLLVVAIGLLLAAPGVRAELLFAYLPESAVNPTQLAQSAEELTRHLAAELPGRNLEAKIFRRLEDADSFLRDSGATVSLLLVDSAYLLNLPPGFEVEPRYRLVRAGQQTRHQLVVVRADSPARTLDELAGKRLSAVPTAGASASLYLERVIFEGRLDPAAFFSRIEPAVDDATALANVQFGTTEAALVAEDNPQLATALDQTVRSVHRSPPISLALLATRRGALDASDLARLDAAIAKLEPAAAARMLAGLRGETLTRLAPTTPVLDRATLLTLGKQSARPLEIALPTAPVELPPPGPVPPAALTYLLELELPAIELESSPSQPP